jgi:hypothetical protein
MSTQPLTEVEAAAARELSRIHNRRDDIPIELEPADFADEARAVVAAVQPILLTEFRDDLFKQAAELPGAAEDDPEAEAREAAADRLLALAPEQATPDAKDAFWRAAAITRSNPLSRPTSEEH